MVKEAQQTEIENIIKENVKKIVAGEKAQELFMEGLLK